jgi:hypothetical protein
MKTAVVYHWWQENSDNPPICNRRSPIVQSIAMLRATNPDIPVYVLDCSSGPNQWHDLPTILNFSVIPTNINLEGYLGYAGCYHLSRIFDVYKFAQEHSLDEVIYQDSDVFWFDSIPRNNPSEKFVFDGSNSGFFRFKMRSELIERFISLFQAFVIVGLNDDAFRFIIKQHLADPQWYYLSDEAVLSYMVNRHGWFYDKLESESHGLARNLPNNPNFKMLHLNGVLVENELAENDNERKHCRGLIGLLIKEVYEALTSQIKEKGLIMMYTEEEREFYKKKVSIRDPKFLSALYETKDSTGHFHLVEAWKRTLLSDSQERPQPIML